MITHLLLLFSNTNLSNSLALNIMRVVVGVLAAVAYFFIEKVEKVEEKHQKYLSKMRNK